MPALDRRWDPLPVNKGMRIRRIHDERGDRFVIEIRMPYIKDGKKNDQREADHGNPDPRQSGPERKNHGSHEARIAFLSTWDNVKALT